MSYDDWLISTDFFDSNAGYVQKQKGEMRRMWFKFVTYNTNIWIASFFDLGLDTM